MKFLKPISNDDVTTLMDAVNLSMLVGSGIKFTNIQEDRTIIKRLAVSLVAIAAQAAHTKKVRDLAMMEVKEEQLVRKVERNGKVFGVIDGGRA